MMSIILNDTEKLIWTLLFSKITVFQIDIEQYCVIENRSEFREQVRTALKRSKISILDDIIIHKEEKIVWKIEIRR